MKHSKQKIILLSIATIITLIIIFFNQEKIEDSLHVYSPFDAPRNELILMYIAYFIVTVSTLYLFQISAIRLFRPLDLNEQLTSRLKENKTIITVLIISILFKQLLYFAQFTYIPLLFELSMNLNLHVDWYFGSELNMPYHFFAWEVIFWIFLILFKLIKRNKFVIFPKT